MTGELNGLALLPPRLPPPRSDSTLLAETPSPRQSSLVREGGAMGALGAAHLSPSGGW